MIDPWEEATPVVGAPGATLATELVAALDFAQAEGLGPNMLRWLRLVGAKKGEWIEVQALDVPERGAYRSNQFAHAPDTATLLKLLAKADASGAVGVYFIANRIDPQVAARQTPGSWHTAKKGESTSERDIRARTVFYVDIDVDRPAGTSATDAQVLLAHERAAAIYADLAELLGGRDALAFGHSGNGRSIFVALDFPPETPELRATVKGLLAALRALFEGGGIKIDQSVSEAKRLVPAWGTMKRKGAPGMAEYPHRRTAILVADKVRRVTQQELDQLLVHLRARLDAAQNAEVDKAMGQRPAAAQKAAPGPSAAPRRAERNPFDEAKQVPIADVLAWLDLMNGDHPVCPGCGLSGDSSVAIVGNGLKCSHDRCATKGVPGNPGFRTPIDVVMEARNVDAKGAVMLIAEQFRLEGFRPAGPKAVVVPTKAPLPRAPLASSDTKLGTSMKRVQDVEVPEALTRLGTDLTVAVVLVNDEATAVAYREVAQAAGRPPLVVVALNGEWRSEWGSLLAKRHVRVAVLDSKLRDRIAHDVAKAGGFPASKQPHGAPTWEELALRVRRSA